MYSHSCCVLLCWRNRGLLVCQTILCHPTFCRGLQATPPGIGYRVIFSGAYNRMRGQALSLEGVYRLLFLWLLLVLILLTLRFCQERNFWVTEKDTKRPKNVSVILYRIVIIYTLAPSSSSSSASTLCPNYLYWITSHSVIRTVNRLQTPCYYTVASAAGTGPSSCCYVLPAMNRWCMCNLCVVV